MSQFYNDSRYGTWKNSRMAPASAVTATSAGGATATALTGYSMKLMENVVVTDFNIRITTGQTNTSAQCFSYILNYSLAGTGAVTALGTATAAAAIADASFINGSVTSTQLAAGDVLLLYQSAGTVLPASSIVLGPCEITMKERFTVTG